MASVLEALMAMENAPTAKRGALGDLLQGFVPNTVMGLQDLYERAKLESTSAALGGDYNPQPVMELATGTLGGGVPFAKQGTAGIFGGRLAATANQAKLAQAESMASKGADKYKIWDETGWFQGADGKWRFEINDAGMNYYREPITPHERNIKGDLRVGDFIEHPELYEAYPKMKTRAYSTQVEADPGAVGSYDRMTGTVSVLQNPPAPLTRRTIALHELQHGVQDIEGFAQGSNLGRAAREFYDPINKRLSELAKEMAVTNPGDPYGQTLRQAYDVLMTKKLETSPKELYYKAPGEVEARNVQARRNLSEDERRIMPPWTTSD